MLLAILLCPILCDISKRRHKVSRSSRFGLSHPCLRVSNSPMMESTSSAAPADSFSSMLNDEKRTERKRVQYQARSGFAVPPPRQRNTQRDPTTPHPLHTKTRAATPRATDSKPPSRHPPSPYLVPRMRRMSSAFLLASVRLEASESCASASAASVDPSVVDLSSLQICRRWEVRF